MHKHIERFRLIKSDKKSWLGYCWRILKSAGERRKLEINLTAFQCEFLLSFPCHYCNKKLEKVGINLDRKDNAKGYIISNVVPCCKTCNIKQLNKKTFEQTGKPKGRRSKNFQRII